MWLSGHLPDSLSSFTPLRREWGVKRKKEKRVIAAGGEGRCREGESGEDEKKMSLGIKKPTIKRPAPGFPAAASEGLRLTEEVSVVSAESPISSALTAERGSASLRLASCHLHFQENTSLPPEGTRRREMCHYRG